MGGDFFQLQIYQTEKQTWTEAKIPRSRIKLTLCTCNAAFPREPATFSTNVMYM